MTADDFRTEAEKCRKSSVGNGEYNPAFHVAYIVLLRIADRMEMEALLAKDQTP